MNNSSRLLLTGCRVGRNSRDVNTSLWESGGCVNAENNMPHGTTVHSQSASVDMPPWCLKVGRRTSSRGDSYWLRCGP